MGQPLRELIPGSFSGFSHPPADTGNSFWLELALMKGSLPPPTEELVGMITVGMTNIHSTEAREAQGTIPARTWGGFKLSLSPLLLEMLEKELLSQNPWSTNPSCVLTVPTHPWLP